MNDVDNLRTRLQEELEKVELDYNRIVSLNQQLIALDKDNVRFTVDAKHIHRLGFELVGKQETALSELIKNSYDADANEVRINFEDFDEPGGTVVIEDDGHGMSEDVIRNAWMRLSTNDKEEAPLSPTYGRSRAGRKGIGRFAVERLGKRLLLVSKPVGSSTGFRVQFSWDEDFTAGADLSQISCKIERFDKPKTDHGTILIVKNLRDKWSQQLFDRVWKSVLLLQPPFVPLKRTRAVNADISNFQADPGFRVYINGRYGHDVAKELSIEKSFLNYSIAKISGAIDDHGEGVIRVVSDKLDLDDEYIIDRAYLLIGELEFDIAYFIYDSSLLTGFSVRRAQEMGEKYGGLRIYRDGFRVLPYGEPEDDWLKLAYDTGRRNLLIPANNNNFFGHIEITSVSNPLFEETSSREGLIENDAYKELQHFTRTCLEWGAQRIAAARGRKQKASQRGFISELRKPSEVTMKLLEELKTGLHPETKGEVKVTSSSHTIKTLENIAQEQQQFEEEAARREKSHIEYEAMLRILASLGISLAVFSHEIRGALTGVHNSIADIEGIVTTSNDAKNENPLANLRAAVDRLYDISNYILTLISHSSTREKKAQPVAAVINSFVREFKNYLNTRGILFKVAIDPPFLRTAPMHRSELDSVLFNFLTNAVKAMDRSNTSKREIRISGTRTGDSVSIRFQDSGPGVPLEIRHKIFDAFFTTSEYKGDEIAGPGSGLGLKIVSDIAEANGGYVEVASPDPDLKCCFKFVVPVSVDQK